MVVGLIPVFAKLKFDQIEVIYFVLQTVFNYNLVYFRALRNEKNIVDC